MRTLVIYTEADVQRAYKAQGKRLKEKFGGDLYTIALEDLVRRQHIEEMLRAAFEAIGMKREES